MSIRERTVSDEHNAAGALCFGGASDDPPGPQQPAAPTLRGGKGLLVVVLHVLLYVVIGFLVLVHGHLLMPCSSLCRANMKSEIGLRFLSHSYPCN